MTKAKENTMHEQLQRIYTRLQEAGETVAAAMIEGVLAYLNERAAHGRPVHTDAQTNPPPNPPDP